MFRKPPVLKPNDTIRIIAPAKAIEKDKVLAAVSLLTSSGYNVEISSHCMGKYNYFSGTLSERLEDMQSALNDPSVKAILCARGGYGSIQLVDKLDWTLFDQNPKWIIGFSDITVFHQRLSKQGIRSIHGTMPLNFETNSDYALASLFDILSSGKQPEIEAPSNPMNIPGKATGTLSGGNASIVYSMLGTNDQPDYSDAILFLEDLSEQLYHMDRIFHSLKKAGVLQQINGLIIGGMTDMKETRDGFGQSLEDIIHHHIKDLGIPLAFEFPAGHIDDNRALLLGENVELIVSETNTRLLSQHNQL